MGDGALGNAEFRGRKARAFGRLSRQAITTLPASISQGLVARRNQTSRRKPR